MQTRSVEKSFCTTREAATLLGVSVGTVQLWVESGLLQAWKTSGGHRRVERSSIEKLLHRPQATAAEPRRRAEDRGQASYSVWVVEDDPDLLQLYQARIGRWPFKPALLGLALIALALVRRPLGTGVPSAPAADRLG